VLFRSDTTQFDYLTQVAHIYDGDTLVLTDGRKIRLIGINTPELARKSRLEQPFARLAHQALQQIVRNNQMQIGIKVGQERLDRYGRTLAHIFTPDGYNIGRLLTEKGLAFANPHPPNLWAVDCYTEAESDARRSGSGLWHKGSNPITTTQSLDQNSGGFHLVRGQITQIKSTPKGTRLTLDRRLSLFISQKNRPLFDDNPLNLEIGASIIVRGWISTRKGDLTMQIRHPSAIERP